MIVWLVEAIVFLFSFSAFVVTHGHAFRARFAGARVAQFIIGVIALVSFVLLAKELISLYSNYASPPSAPPTETKRELRSAEDYFVRGVEAANSGRNADAIRDFNMALTLRPNYVGALLRRSQAYRALGQIDPAIADIEQALQIQPNSSEARAQQTVLLDLRTDRLLEPLWSDIAAGN